MVAPLVPAGTAMIVRGVKLVAVPLSRIRPPAIYELDQARLIQLKSGFNSLDEILSNPQWQGDPITLTRSGNFYNVEDGRHRVSLAIGLMKDKIDFVWARVLG